ncbi:hypothetical protein V2S66_24060 [Streptomyces sp. V4-01]|uniref:Ppx/GppA phosphatase N-terminal domain-containing protein n=1 Tax=Actinacidiphila polyblastidii TaxID=3110430 RepID=A0ABU7PIA3_9ACTN|nr:hypothetical protein [Streptomyces sp. V4-01]
MESRKVRLRLHHDLALDGRLRKPGMRSVEQAVAEAVAADPRLLAGKVFAFATSVIRDAPNRDEVIDRVARTTGVRLRVLPGEEEARLAYVAARQWAASRRPGRAPGELLVLDIGGGTLEVAAGDGDDPRAVLSLPLGARRVTRDALPGGVASSPRELARVRRCLRRSLRAVPELPRAAEDGRTLACSKTFTQLARLAATLKSGPRSSRSPQRLTLAGVRAAIPVLAGTDVADRAKLAGISAHRAEQTLAGALVAEALMEACAVRAVTICPWSTREGLLLEALGATAAHRGGRAA